MKRNLVFALLSVLVITLSGCADRKNLSPMPSIAEKTKGEMAAPVDCATADHDIKVLEEERASVAKRIFTGVRSVFPIAAAAGILLGDYRDRVEVATGKYNSDLEAKIAEIKQTCNIY